MGQVGELHFGLGRLDLQPLVSAEIAAGPAVEMHAGGGDARLWDDADADDLVRADDERAVGERVRADRRQDDGVGVGTENRAARRERVGRGARRRRDDQPIADVFGDEVIADLDADAREVEPLVRVTTMSLSAQGMSWLLPLAW